MTAGIGVGKADQIANPIDMARCFMDNAARLAGVVELVDAPDSKSGARNGVGVQVPPPAPYKRCSTAQENPFIPCYSNTIFCKSKVNLNPASRDSGPVSK